VSRPGPAEGAQRRVVSFARTDGRALRPRYHASEQAGRTFVLDPPRGETSTSIAPGSRLDPAAAFGRTAPLVVEIGSGVGESLVYAAQRHPEADFLGVEVYRPGNARTLAAILREGLTNVRMVRADGVEVLEHWVEPGSLSQVWTFFPDPWPKTKHRKRRLVDDEFALLVARSLRPGGTWRLATDWAPYAQQMRDVIRACPTLDNPYHVPAVDEPEAGFAPRFEGRPMTKFERKGTEAGQKVRDLTARPRSR
jgi:tRNA (guanine-N7-)-methyltransferase